MTANEPPQEPPCILVADDEPEIRELLGDTLRAAGYRVVLAADGSEALEQVAREQPAVVVLDVMMPRLDGFEVLKRLRADPATSSLRVILLLARSADGHPYQDLSQQFDVGVVSKPVRPADLLQVVESVL